MFIAFLAMFGHWDAGSPDICFLSSKCCLARSHARCHLSLKSMGFSNSWVFWFSFKGHSFSEMAIGFPPVSLEWGNPENDKKLIKTHDTSKALVKWCTACLNYTPPWLIWRNHPSGSAFCLWATSAASILPFWRHLPFWQIWKIKYDQICLPGFDPKKWPTCFGNFVSQMTGWTWPLLQTLANGHCWIFPHYGRNRAQCLHRGWASPLRFGRVVLCPDFFKLRHRGWMRSAHTGGKNGTLEPRARASSKRQKWRTTVDYNQFRWGPTWVIYQAVPWKLGYASPHYFHQHAIA